MTTSSALIRPGKAVSSWLIAAAATRYSSLAAILTVAALPFLTIGLGQGQTFILGFFLTALIYLKHLGNIQRLRLGKEPKIKLSN